MLVVAGVYSVIAQVVVERQRDLATRSALDAGPRQVVITALQSPLRPAAIGIGFRGLGALGTTRVLTSLLSEVSALDIVTWTETLRPAQKPVTRMTPRVLQNMRVPSLA